MIYNVGMKYQKHTSDMKLTSFKFNAETRAILSVLSKRARKSKASLIAEILNDKISRLSAELSEYESELLRAQLTAEYEKTKEQPKFRMESSQNDNNNPV